MPLCHRIFTHKRLRWITNKRRRSGRSGEDCVQSCNTYRFWWSFRGRYTASLGMNHSKSAKVSNFITQKNWTSPWPIIWNNMYSRSVTTERWLTWSTMSIFRWNLITNRSTETKMRIQLLFHLDSVIKTRIFTMFMTRILCKIPKAPHIAWNP